MNELDKKLHKIIIISLEELWKNDGELILNNVREETINKQLSNYLEKNIRNQIDIGERKIDVEYDKNMNEPKKVLINGKEEIVRPDIIVHKRKSNELNFLIVEAKKTEDSHYDNNKIIGFLMDERYNYDYGAFIRYTPDDYYMELRFYYKNNNGEVVININEVEKVK